jgi:hypothetical protein
VLDFLSYGGMGYDSDVNNGVNAGNVYPTAGKTTGARGSAMTPYATGAFSQDSKATAPSGAPDAGSASPGGGIFGQPLTWWVVILALLVGLMFAAKRAGQGSEFGNIKASVYNIAVITLAAAVGVGFLKVVFGKYQVPGLSTYIQAL